MTAASESATMPKAADLDEKTPIEAKIVNVEEEEEISPLGQANNKIRIVHVDDNSEEKASDSTKTPKSRFSIDNIKETVVEKFKALNSDSRRSSKSNFFIRFFYTVNFLKKLNLNYFDLN